MPYSAYKLLHFFGIIMTFTALGGVFAHAASGGTRETSGARPWLAFLHGAGGLLILVGGFGMQAKVVGLGWPGWLIAKLVIWTILGAGSFFPYRKPAAARPFLAIFPLLGMVAAYLVLFRPF